MSPDPTIRAIEARIEELFLTYDGRLVAATLGVRCAEAYRTLRVIGCETPESLRKIFDYLNDIAQSEPEKAPKVVYESDEPKGMQ